MFTLVNKNKITKKIYVFTLSFVLRKALYKPFLEKVLKQNAALVKTSEATFNNTFYVRFISFK